jgi:regulator of protease activity HflC (stomatin/prohibitin superfamily)
MLTGMAATLCGLLAASFQLQHRAPIFHELARSGVVSVPLAVCLVALAGFAATAIVARRRLAGTPRQTGRAARWPQVAVVPVLALAGAVIAWKLRPGAGAIVAMPGPCYAAGAAAMGLSFPLLLTERWLAMRRLPGLPEAAALHALARLATLVVFGAGLLEVAAAYGLPLTDRVFLLPVLAVMGTGGELAARALARVFLPPPEAALARGACHSTLAALLTAGPGEQGVAAPMRAHLGIDFSRSWALAYVRGAFLPMVGGLALLAWGLTGVMVVPLDQRAIYERFGAPVRVLHPGLHLGLPWPLGMARRLEFGAVHEAALAASGPSTAAPRVGAEEFAPATADRLWETAHEGEITLAIASGHGARQSFQSVSADIRLLYRVGLTDSQALQATYSAADPQLLVQAVGGRAIADFYAARTLEQVLGADREATAQTLRDRMQAALDGFGSGLEMVGVVIEAIHPPPGAADAYHYVRAAEIAAQAKIAAERGNAIVIAAQSRQYADSQVSTAKATAAEVLAGANAAQARFAADQEAARVGGRAFVLERYFTDVSQALGKSPLTILDHRLAAPDAAVLDLRPPSGAPASTGTGE